MPDEKPRRLKVLPNGNIEVPVLGARKPDGTREDRPPLVLAEPDMVELAEIQDLVIAADDAVDAECGELEPLPPDLAARVLGAGEVTAEEREFLKRRQAIVDERQRLAYSPKSPHGAAMREVCKLLTGVELGPADLPGWCGHPGTVGEVLTRFMDPFAGRADELKRAAQAVTESGAP